jgi:DnaK suppressor protein
MTESHLTARAEQSMALALERERARLVASLRALDVRTQALGEAQAEELAAGGEPADVASELNQQEVELTLARVERTRLALVDDALHRLAEGRYGICDECGHPIGLARLQALPWALRCRRCVEQPHAAPRGPSSPGDAGVNRAQALAATPFA